MDISYILRTVDDPLIQRCSDLVAISFEDRESITYGDLLAKTRAAMGGLESRGVKYGDRIALLAYNSIDYWILYFAVTGLGAIVVKLNWRLASEEVDYAITDCGASVVFVSPEFSGSVGFLGNRPEIYVVSMSDHFTLDSGRASDAAMDDILAGEHRDFLPTMWPPSTPAVIMYTSGTTGRPKGAVWTHSNAISYASMQALHWGIDRHTKALTTGPFYHVGAFENLLTPTLLMKGTAVFTQSTGFSIERTATVMADLKINCALLYPFMISDLVSLNADLLNRLVNLRMLVTGGSAIAPPIVRELRRLLPRVDLVQTYGSTEGGAISTASVAQDSVDFPECVGQSFELSQVKICIDDAGTSAPVGNVGEVWVRSPSVSIGYWNRPHETAETFIDGWCRTGDLGLVNSGGRLQITGRKKDMIRSGGENVYPAELEMVLIHHSAVADLAIIGVPDLKYEEAVCAVIVVKQGVVLDPEEFRTYAGSRLAKYKVPTHIEIIDELPRTASGKIQKFVLRERYAYLANNN